MKKKQYLCNAFGSETAQTEPSNRLIKAAPASALPTRTEILAGALIITKG